MEKRIEKAIAEQKHDLKEKICKEIDRYYDCYQQPGQRITINDIEQFLIKSKAKIDDLINEATPDIVETQQTVTKKNRASNAGPVT
jgi:hypothetical protein